MRSALPQIATQLGADERTLRRAIARGAIRAERPSPRALTLTPSELEYLRSHWPLLNALTRALRCEPNLDLAVLYGSTARGDEHATSDVDVLASFRTDHAGAAAGLARRLERVTMAPIDVARLSRVRGDAPLLVLSALDEGRVLIDRDGSWEALQAQRASIARAARRKRQRDREQAATSIARLIEVS